MVRANPPLQIPLQRDRELEHHLTFTNLILAPSPVLATAGESHSSSFTIRTAEEARGEREAEGRCDQTAVFSTRGPISAFPLSLQQQ